MNFYCAAKEKWNHYSSWNSSSLISGVVYHPLVVWCYGTGVCSYDVWTEIFCQMFFCGQYKWWGKIYVCALVQCLLCIVKIVALNWFPWLDCVQIHTAIGIKEPLCRTSSFTVLYSIDLFLSLSVNPFSMSNPLWCSHVCWSLARVAWDYSTRTHTHSFIDDVGYHRNVPGDVHVDCGRPPSGLEGNLLCGTGSRETFLSPPTGSIKGRWISGKSLSSYPLSHTRESGNLRKKWENCLVRWIGLVRWKWVSSWLILRRICTTDVDA